MAKVRAGKLGKGSFIGPRGNNILDRFSDHRDYTMKPIQPVLKKPYFYNLSPEEVVKELDDFNRNMDKFAEIVIQANKFQIAQIVKNRLYALNTDSDEKLITTEPYAMREANANLARNQIKTNRRGDKKIVERYDLYNTGTFYNSLSVELVFGQLLVTSNDPKKDELMEKFGSNVFQLTTKEVDWVWDNIIDKEIQTALDAITVKANFLIENGLFN